MLRNYTMGMIMSTLDGPLHTADWIKATISENGDLQSLKDFSAKVHGISARELREMAREFLREDAFFSTWVT